MITEQSIEQTTKHERCFGTSWLFLIYRNASLAMYCIYWIFSTSSSVMCDVQQNSVEGKNLGVWLQTSNHRTVRMYSYIFYAIFCSRSEVRHNGRRGTFSTIFYFAWAFSSSFFLPLDWLIDSIDQSVHDDLHYSYLVTTQNADISNYADCQNNVALCGTWCRSLGLCHLRRTQNIPQITWRRVFRSLWHWKYRGKL